MENGIKPFRPAKRKKTLSVTHVKFIKCRSLINIFFRTAAQIVYNGNLVAGFYEGIRYMRTDKSGTARY